MSDAPPSTRFAVLQFGEVTLAVPLAQVQALEPVLDITLGVNGAAAGTVVVRGTEHPVFALGAELQPLAAPLPQQRICAVLGPGTPWFGLLCDRVSLFEEFAAEHAVPAIAAARGMAFDSLFVRGEQVLCRSSAERLAQHLRVQAGAP